MLINLRNALMGGKRLPYDAEVEYLQSSGTQYVDTGIVPTVNTRWECLCAPTTTSTQFMGCISSAAYRFHFSFYDAGYIRGCMALTQVNLLNADTAARNYFIDAQNKTAGYDSTTISAVYDGNIPEDSIWLFGRNSSRSSYQRYISIKIYASKIYDNGILVRDYIPVRKGAVGYLYDRVSGALFGNAGTGDFVLGPDVVPVEYLESVGYQYIDTGVVPDFNTEVRLIAGYTARVDWTAIFGARTGSGNSERYFPFSATNQSTTARMVMADSEITFPYTYDGSLHNVIFNDEYHRCYFDGMLKTTLTSGNTVSENNPLYIFGTSGYGTDKWAASGRVASAEIIKSSSPIRRFRSVRVGTDATSWEGAMMDVLTRRIYRNAGAGAFTYGNDLPYPIPAE